MKKPIPLIFVLIFPYIPIILISCNADMVVVTLATLAVFTLAMLSSIINFAMALWKKWDSKQLALSGMIIKILQIPAYLIFFVMGLTGMLFVHLLQITLIMFLFDCVLIFMSGLVSLVSVIRAKQENKISTVVAIVFGITSFVFCIDVIISVVLYIKIRIVAKKTKDTVETEHTQAG